MTDLRTTVAAMRAGAAEALADVLRQDHPNLIVEVTVGPVNGEEERTEGGGAN